MNESEKSSAKALDAWKRRHIVREDASQVSPMRRKASITSASKRAVTHHVVPFGNVSSHKEQAVAPPTLLQTPQAEVLALPYNHQAPNAPLPQEAISFKQLLRHDASSLNPKSIAAAEAKMLAYKSVLTPSQFESLFLDKRPPTDVVTTTASISPGDALRRFHQGEPTTHLNCSSIKPANGAPSSRRCSRRALNWDATHHNIPMIEESLDVVGDAEGVGTNFDCDATGMGGNLSRHGASRYFYRKGGLQGDYAAHPLEPRREMHANRLKQKASSFTFDDAVVTGGGASPLSERYTSDINDWLTSKVTRAPVPEHRGPTEVNREPSDRHRSNRLLKEFVAAHKGYRNL